MNDYSRAIEKAIAELSVAQALGPFFAIAALKQARFHINLALDDAQRKQRERTPCTTSSPAMRK